MSKKKIARSVSKIREEADKIDASLDKIEEKEGKTYGDPIVMLSE